MTKSKSSASSIVVPSIYFTHLVNGARFLNATFVAGAVISIVIITSIRF